MSEKSMKIRLGLRQFSVAMIGKKLHDMIFQRVEIDCLSDL